MRKLKLLPCHHTQSGESKCQSSSWSPWKPKKKEQNLLDKYLVCILSNPATWSLWKTIPWNQQLKTQPGGGGQGAKKWGAPSRGGDAGDRGAPGEEGIPGQGGISGGEAPGERGTQERRAQTAGYHSFVHFQHLWHAIICVGLVEWID
jgi:hypothetical protein